jgi:nucleotide-binding universal stress UspA family protein
VTVLHVIPDLLEEFSSGAGMNLMDHIGHKEWDAFNRNSITKAKNAIQNRIRETARNVTKEIPFCPLTMENIMIKVGKPVEQIVESARQGGFDLVIMGAHGHGKIEEALVGNVAAGVIRKCTIPVMTVRLP